MRHVGAGCLLAVGVWVTVSTGIAMAQPGSGQQSGGDGTTTSSATGSAGGKQSTGFGPRRTAGSGRAGTTNPTSSVDSLGDSTAETRDPGWLLVRLRVSLRQIPSLWFLPGMGRDTVGATGYMQSWQQTVDRFADVIVPRPPGPQPGPQIRTQIIQEEPVVDTTSGGGSVYPLPEPGNLPVPSVLQAPIVLTPAVPVRVIAPPVAAAPAPRVLPVPVALPPGTNLPWVPPRALAEPPAGAPTPKIGNAVPPAHEPVPGVGTSMNSQASFRVGYADYLRTAGVPQLVAMALPGIAGILLLTASGGFIGYRQAKAGSTVRTTSIERFLA
jgi:hypothetical protein